MHLKENIDTSLLPQQLTIAEKRSNTFGYKEKQKHVLLITLNRNKGDLKDRGAFRLIQLSQDIIKGIKKNSLNIEPVN